MRFAKWIALVLVVGCSKPVPVEVQFKKQTQEDRALTDPLYAGLSPDDAKKARADYLAAYDAADRLLLDTDLIKGDEKKRLAVVEQLKVIHAEFKLRKERDGIKSASAWMKSKVHGKTCDDILKETRRKR